MLKINFLGDSITEGACATAEENTYVQQVGKMTGAIVRNYGISATRIAIATSPSVDPRWDMYFGSRVDNMDTDADLVFVFGGTNDFGHHNVIYGQIGDKTPNTFCGAVDYLINKLLQYFKNEQIIFITPLYCSEEFREEFEHPLEDFRKAIIEVAKSYDVKVMDIKDDIGMPFDNPMIADGLHPTDLGHHRIAELITDFIRKLGYIK